MKKWIKRNLTSISHKSVDVQEFFEFNWLLNVTCNDISVIYVTAHRCAGGLKKKLDLRRAPNAIDIS